MIGSARAQDTSAAFRIEGTFFLGLGKLARGTEMVSADPGTARPEDNGSTASWRWAKHNE